MFERLKRLLFGRGQVTETRISREDKEGVEDAYKRQVGQKDAKIMDLNKQLKEMEKKFDKVKKERNKEKKKKQKERAERLGEKPYTDKQRLSLKRLFKYVDSKEEVRVLSREHMFLGFLEDVYWEPVGDKMSWHIITNNGDGKRFDVIDGFNLQNLIHRPNGTLDTLENGILVVNRSFFKRSVIPDSYITEHGKPKHIESLLQEKEEQMNQIYSRLVNAKEREQKERTRRKEENLGKQVQKARADTIQKDILADIKDFSDSVSRYREVTNQLQEEQTKNTSLKNHVQSLQSSVKDVFDELEERMPKDDVAHAREQFMEEMDKLKEITKEDSGGEG